MAESTDDQSGRHPFQLKQLAEKKYIERIIGATLAILVTNIAKYFLSVERVNGWFVKVAGVPPSAYINTRNLTIVILFIAYSVALYFLYKKFISSTPIKKRIPYATLAIVGTAAIFLINVHSLPRRPDPSRSIPTEKWSNIIAESQASSGGIRAKPGDLSFPTQVWTTAQALTAMLADQSDLDDAKIPVVKKAFAYIENARHPNASGSNGFDEGWGLFEQSKKSTTEIAAWVTVAHISSLESKKAIWDANEAATIRERIQRDLALILRRQSKDGGWRPIEEDEPKFTRTYSTGIALWSLIEARRSKFVHEAITDSCDSRISDGIAWLLHKYQTKTLETGETLAWVPNPNRDGQREPFAGLTAQILFILSRIEDQPGFDYLKTNSDLLSYKRAFIAQRNLAGRPVWSNDRIHDFDLSFTRDNNTVDFVLEGSTLLWFPWSYAALTALSRDSALTTQEQGQALNLRKEILETKVDDLNHFVHQEFMYVLAENLYCFAVSQSVK
jgi:hypothetical protein